jgi:hypothetical protein
MGIIHLFLKRMDWAKGKQEEKEAYNTFVFFAIKICS